MHDQADRRRVIAAVVVIGISAVLAVAYGTSYGAGNQATYLPAPFRLVHPELYGRDWFLSTTQYHPVFAWLVAPLYLVDPRGVTAFAIAQLVAMIATFALLYRLIAALARPGRLPMFVLLVGVLALGGGRAMAGSYLFAGYLQPSSFATLGWLAAMLAWIQDRPVHAGLWLGLAGACHVNFLILGIGLFAAIELSSWRVDVRRLAAVLGPSLLVLVAFLPALQASAQASDPETALHLLIKFHAPGHYDPTRVRRWLPPLIAWLLVAWGALPALRGTVPGAVERLWRFTAVGTALCVVATAIVSIPPWLGFTRLYVWRIAPFAQLASQLIVIAAALAPPAARPGGADAGAGATTDASAPGSPRRVYALLIGAVTLVVESTYLGGGNYPYTAVLGLVAAVWLAARWLRRRALAIVLAVAACGLAVARQRSVWLDPPLLDSQAGPAYALYRWARSQTPVDAMFLVPPYLGSFRLLAGRAVVADTKSPPLYPDELVAWYRRLCAIVGATEVATHEAVEAQWDGLAADQLIATARRFDADYVVLDKLRSSARLAGVPVVFESDDRVVFRVR